MYTSHISLAQNSWSLHHFYILHHSGTFIVLMYVYHYHLRSIVYTRIHSWGYTFYVLCLIAQSCLTFCDPVDCILPGSFVMGILQARITEWVAMPSSSVAFGKCVISYVHSTHIAQFQCPKNTVCSSLHLSSPPLNPWKLMFFLPSQQFYPFQNVIYLELHRMQLFEIGFFHKSMAFFTDLLESTD